MIKILGIKRELKFKTNVYLRNESYMLYSMF